MSSKKRRAGDEAEVDRSSELPCDILVNILSCLTVKEAAKTSLVSRRWRNLWKSFMGVLEFDQWDFRLGDGMERIRKFVTWVTQVLNSLQNSPTVEALRIMMDRFDVGWDKAVEDWIRFSIQKKVKTLKLHLKGLNIPYFKLPSALISAFSSLRALHLKNVDVTAEDMHSLTSSCAYLEKLSLELCGIEALKLCAPQLKLKLVEISAEHLLSFFYCRSFRGPKPRLNFISAPSLEELYQEFFHGFPELRNLKHPELCLDKIDLVLWLVLPSSRHVLPYFVLL